jgi:hypothetical protein
VPDIPTFIRCHINAFEYFAGVPSTIKIDNLKSGVLLANFYEPSIQVEYANMLNYYGSVPIACRVKTPEEKGKVESAIKYVKNNFLKNLKTDSLSELKSQLCDWQDTICNKRIHGTTRKVPYDEFMEKEKSHLNPLPLERYEVYEIEHRKVNKYGHITYRYNFYSVPEKYVLQDVTIKSNGKVIRIFDDKLNEIAVHQVSNSKGEFVTNSSHNIRAKFQTNENQYSDKSLKCGVNVHEFYLRVKDHRPHHYHRTLQGIFNLCTKYGDKVVDKACKRANNFGLYNYLSVRKICESGLFEDDNLNHETVLCGGYYNQLQEYDKLTGGVNAGINQETL